MTPAELLFPAAYPAKDCLKLGNRPIIRNADHFGTRRGYPISRPVTGDVHFTAFETNKRRSQEPL